MATVVVLTTAGKGITTGLITGITSLVPKYVAIGSGGTGAVVAATSLSTEYTTGTWTGYARVSSTMTQQTTTVANDTAQYAATFTAPSAETVTNAGNFDALTTGNLHVLGSFTGIALNTGDSVAVTIDLQFT